MLIDYVVPADTKILCVGGWNVHNIAICSELLNHLVSYELWPHSVLVCLERYLNLDNEYKNVLWKMVN